MGDSKSNRRQAARAARGLGHGPRCGERTRSGGKCILTLGHSGGHYKAPKR